MNKARDLFSNAKTITSRHNSLVGLARDARDGKNKELIFIEGLRLCEEVFKAGLTVEAVLFSERFAQDARAARLFDSYRDVNATFVKVTDEIINLVADTKTPQGLILLARRPLSGQSVLENVAYDNPLIIVMHRIGNPSNAGAMLRVAEAAGATGVIVTRHTTDLFSPKSLRGSMGSAFRLPIWTHAEFEQALSWCQARGITTVGTSLGAHVTHAEWDWTRASAIVMGAEGSGLDAEEASAADTSVRIPMREPVESLNVSVALAVLLYEAARQRNYFQTHS